MADMNDPARELIELGDTEARLMRQLIRVQTKRCALLQKHGADMGLAPDVVARASEPKRR
jgi:hypothetical protein